MGGVRVGFRPAPGVRKCQAHRTVVLVVRWAWCCGRALALGAVPLVAIASVVRLRQRVGGVSGARWR